MEDRSAANRYHRPVLCREAVEGLLNRPNGIYVDATFGGGGHSQALLSKMGTHGRLIALDLDSDTKENLIEDKRLTFVRGNFRFLRNYLNYLYIEQIDGLLADLGVSSHQLDEPTKGFTFRSNSPLDMRMNSSQKICAKEVLNRYTEERLADVFYHYGELREARRLARTICQRRAISPLETSQDLIECIGELLPKQRDYKVLAPLFQALRIEVNQELLSLKLLLNQAVERIREGGKLAIIAYHSLEDRMVKQFLRMGTQERDGKADIFGNRQTPFKIGNRKVIVPTEEELQGNPRARSAKLRIATRV